jgi:uncharacterized protein YdhG (YjbR/CyaY superfamily)
VKKNKAGNMNSVDGYLAPLPDEVRNMLEKIRAAIKSAAPKAEEVISYQIPAYKFHCALYVLNPGILELFKDELKQFKTSETIIHFSVDNPIPTKLVKQIVEARIKENTETIKFL